MNDENLTTAPLIGGQPPTPALAPAPAFAPVTVLAPALVVPAGPVVTVVKGRHFLAVFFISYMWGTFGIDRFYLGKVWTGLLKLVTFGGLGLWTIIDLVLIMSGAMRDKQGREMLEGERYKKFAANTILISALVIGLVVLLSGISLIYTVTQLIQSGALNQLIPTAGATAPASLDPSQLGL